MIYIDLAKAFDTVPHERLLDKVKSYGIDNHYFNWIRDYLNNRYLRVKIDGKLSDPHRANSGIFQGSILGPLLFLIFINDLPSALSSSGALFADDTKIWGPSDDPAALQKSLDILFNWVTNNGMSINTNKCSIVPI